MNDILIPIIKPVPSIFQFTKDDPQNVRLLCQPHSFKLEDYLKLVDDFHKTNQFILFIVDDFILNTIKQFLISRYQEQKYYILPLTFAIVLSMDQKDSGLIIVQTPIYKYSRVLEQFKFVVDLQFFRSKETFEQWFFELPLSLRQQVIEKNDDFNTNEIFILIRRFLEFGFDKFSLDEVSKHLQKLLDEEQLEKQKEFQEAQNGIPE